MPTSKQNLYSIEIHRHGRPTVNTFLTEVCVGFSTTTSVRPPHAQGQFTFMLRVSESDAVLPGDWLVQRDARGYVGFWGRVAAVSDGITVGENHAVTTNPTTVHVEGWTELLQKAALFSPGGYLAESVGTLYTQKDWVTAIGAICQDWSNLPLGVSLEKLLKIVGRILLPETLGGGYLGDEIKVVYDKPTAWKYAPELADEQESLPSANTTLDNIATQSVQANAYDILRQLFVPEPSLIEMFPYLSVMYEAQQQMTPEGQGAAPDPGPTPAMSGYAPWNTPAVASTVEPYTELAKALRGRPVLVYRIVPWRTRALKESIFTQEKEADWYLTAADLVSGKTKVLPSQVSPTQDMSTTFPILDVMFNETTWTNGNLVHLPSSAVINMTRTRNDSARVNCAWMPTAAGIKEAAIEGAGLPVRITQEILDNGLRAASPTWPFSIRRDQLMSVNEGEYLDYLRVICVQIMQFYHHAHVLGTGSITAAYLPTLHRNVHERAHRVGDNAPLTAGRSFVIDMPNGIPPYFAYTDSITHEVQVNGTAVVGTTQIGYSRGLYGWDEDSLRDSPVPVPTMTMTRVAPPKTLSGRSASGGPGVPGFARPEVQPGTERSGRLAGLQTWVESKFEPEFEKYLAESVDLLAVKLADDAAVFDSLGGAARLRKFCDDHNRIMWGWGWHNCTTLARAKQEGRVAAQQALKWRTPVYLINAESVWAGQPTDAQMASNRNITISTDPEGNMLAFLDEFEKVVGNRVSPAWNGYHASVRYTRMTPTGVVLPHEGQGTLVRCFTDVVAQRISDMGGYYMPMCYYYHTQAQPSSSIGNEWNGLAYRVSKYPDLFRSPGVQLFTGASGNNQRRGMILGDQNYSKKHPPKHVGDWYRPDGFGEAQQGAPYVNIALAWYGGNSAGRLKGSKGYGKSLANLLNDWRRTPL